MLPQLFCAAEHRAAARHATWFGGSALQPPNHSDALDLRGFAELERVLSHDLAAAAPAQLAVRCSQTRAGCTLTSAAVPHLYLNRVLVDVDAELDAVDQMLGEATRPDRAPNFVAQLWEHSTCAYEAALRQRGLVPFRRDWLVLARPCGRAPVVSTSFRIARARRDDATAFAELLGEGLDFPTAMAPLVAALIERAGWHCYLAWDGPRPVAASALFVRGKLGMLAMAATRPSHRGGGAHDALVARRIQVATALGCDALFVETGAPVAGEPSPTLVNLQAAGFGTVAARRCLVPPGTTWAGR